MEGRKILYLGIRDPRLLSDLSLHCRLNGFSLIIIDVEDYSGAVSALEGEYEILLVDFPMKSQELMVRILSRKEREPIPLVFVLDNRDESDQIRAFSLGADDVFFREFFSGGNMLLLHRMESLVQIYGKGEKTQRKSWMIGDNKFSLHPSERRAELNGCPVNLTLTEWNILSLLCEKKGRVVSRESILDRCFGQYDGYDRSIDTHIKNLRKKIPGAIGTKRGMGYRFLGE